MIIIASIIIIAVLAVWITLAYKAYVKEWIDND